MNQPRSTSASAPRKVALALTGRRLARRFHVGRSRPDARGRDDRHYRRHRDQCRSHECHCARRWDGTRGPEARPQLARQFWEAIGKMVGFNSFLPWPMSGESAANTPLEQNPLYVAATMICRQLSPYDLNPFNYNPLCDFLIELIDFEGLKNRTLSRS